MNRILTTGLIAALAVSSGCSRQEDAPETTQAPEGAPAPTVAATPEESAPDPAPATETPAAESAPEEATPDPVSTPETPPTAPPTIPPTTPPTTPPTDPPTEAPVEAPVTPTPADAVALLVQQGGELFGGGSCFRCHGADAKGGERGPDLTNGEWAHGDGSAEAIAATIKAGVAQEDIVGGYEFFMAPKARMDISDEQVAAIAAYILSLGEGNE